MCWGHIRWLGDGCFGFRPYGGSLWKSPKVTKGLLPHHSAPRSRFGVPERRLESVGNPAGRRVSRVGPWMARHGGPRFQAGVRAHRAWARCRVVGQRPFGYFWLGRHSGRLPKVTRCKSGTLSGRYRSNGYVLNPPTTKPPTPPHDCCDLGNSHYLVTLCTPPLTCVNLTHP